MAVEGEDRACGTQLGTHVADGGLARGGEALHALAEIFEYGVGAALDGEDAQILRMTSLGEPSPTGDR
jgi:hypothetical protein